MGCSGEIATQPAAPLLSRKDHFLHNIFYSSKFHREALESSPPGLADKACLLPKGMWETLDVSDPRGSQLLRGADLGLLSVQICGDFRFSVPWQFAKSLEVR